MKYSISDLAYTKGISEPVRQALYEMEEEISKKDKRIAELAQALRDAEQSWGGSQAKEEAMQRALEGKP
jgi:Arc/MetJ-type ribon-helix-helix transcriptional regulator